MAQGTPASHAGVSEALWKEVCPRSGQALWGLPFSTIPVQLGPGLGADWPHLPQGPRPAHLLPLPSLSTEG